MSKPRFIWTRLSGSADHHAEMPGGITLYVVPEHTKGFTGEPRRGTKWRFGASHWDERTRTVSRFGRDAWRELADSRAGAQRAAEALYLEALGAP